ncbi:MAG: ABC transporter ATP-binding protein, partial [Gemmatimonadota bacterium]|nr:ABC transporter ATP-binding protein [Gemmatimonadota bacterium]
EVERLSYRPAADFELKEVALTVPQGSVYGFLGPNGSGKTTTIRLLMGFHKADKGEISLLGHSVPGQITEALARTGYVPERPHLYPTLTVMESVRYHRPFYERWDERWTDELFDRFQLAPDRRVGKLSKGEVGKLMILLALAQRPDLLIMDEPTEGLDPIVRRDITSAVMDYVSEQGASVLISSHLVHELERICDRIGVMDQGRLVIEMPMHEFKSGIKKLRITDPPKRYEDAPFDILMREPANGGAPGEMLLVRGWKSDMSEFFGNVDATLRDVVDLDLEDGFVEMLRAFRAEMGER